MNTYVSSTLYDDIILMKHYRSLSRRPMSQTDRAAQFSPFSALTGLNEELDETARLTESLPTLSEGQTEVINNKLRYIADCHPCDDIFQITYFEPDMFKEGGRFLTVSSRVKRFDEASASLLLENGISIKAEYIMQII